MNLGRKTPFFHKLVADLAAVMGEAYPELVAARDRVTAVLKQEEERFAETLENGMGVLETAMASEDRMLDGETVFKLNDQHARQTPHFTTDSTCSIGAWRTSAPLTM